MQLAAAGLFAVDALFTLISSFFFINRDALLRQIQANTNLPAGTNVDQIVSISLFFAWAVVVFLVVLWLVAALGSYLGWRWIFWADLVLFGFGTIGALLNLANFANPDKSTAPLWGVAVSELLDVASAGMFVWMVIALITRGPWALRRVGA